MNGTGLAAEEPREKIGWRVAILVVATLAVFAPVMWQGGFFWDDYDLIVRNPLMRAAGGAGLRDFWFTTKNFDYFPLTSTTFWIEWRLWGAWAQPYHVLNVLLHLGSVLLLWRILKQLGVPGAFWAALVFAVHPVNVESVAWISERKNTLSMFLMCVSVAAYLRFERTRSAAVYGGAVGAFVLALLAKTAVVMLPFVLLLLAWYRRGKVTKRDVMAAGPFFLASFLLGLITVFFSISGRFRTSWCGRIRWGRGLQRRGARCGFICSRRLCRLGSCSIIRGGMWGRLGWWGFCRWFCWWCWGCRALGR